MKTAVKKKSPSGKTAAPKKAKPEAEGSLKKIEESKLAVRVAKDAVAEGKSGLKKARLALKKARKNLKTLKSKAGGKSKSKAKPASEVQGARQPKV